MPYVIVEGIFGEGRKLDYDGSSDLHAIRSNTLSSTRQSVERNQIQQTKQPFYTSVSGLKGKKGNIIVKLLLDYYNII